MTPETNQPNDGMITERDIRDAVAKGKPVEDVRLPVVFPNAAGITQEELMDDEMDEAKALRILTPRNGDEGVPYGKIAASYYLLALKHHREKVAALIEAADRMAEAVAYRLKHDPNINWGIYGERGEVIVTSDVLSDYRALRNEVTNCAELEKGK